MDNQQVIDIAVKVDRLVLESRLRDLALVAQTDRTDRIGAVVTVISKLRAGAYLIGCGPYSCGILPLTVDEVVLGRPPSPLEKLPDSVPDFTLNDAVWMIPREASRIHASVIRRTEDGKATYCIVDEHSQTGTFVNCQRVGGEDGTDNDRAVELADGDIVSLGPSGVNCYIFFVAG